MVAHHWNSIGCLPLVYRVVVVLSTLQWFYGSDAPHDLLPMTATRRLGVFTNDSHSFRA